MASTRPPKGDAYRKVLAFIFRHWAKQPVRLVAMFFFFMLATVLDVLTPLYAGRLVEAVSIGGDSALNAAIEMFVVLIALGLGAVIVRQLGFMSLIRFTLKMMGDTAQDAFHRVQRFSSDWHANTFAGSTVRKVTRGMWALDLLNDTILIALFPSLVMLVGSTVLLGWYWPLMGLVIAIGSLLFIAITAALSLGYVAPAARLANIWDTKLGGSLADAVSCNAVVKAFGAERREEARLTHVIGKWRKRTHRTWVRATVNGTAQIAALVALRAAVLRS